MTAVAHARGIFRALLHTIPLVLFPAGMAIVGVFMPGGGS